jgi:hypothetical protein
MARAARCAAPSSWLVPGSDPEPPPAPANHADGRPDGERQPVRLHEGTELRPRNCGGEGGDGERDARETPEKQPRLGTAPGAGPRTRISSRSATRARSRTTDAWNPSRRSPSGAESNAALREAYSTKSSAKAAQTGKAIQSARSVKIRPAPFEAGRFDSTRTSRLLGLRVVTTTSLGKEKRASYQQRQGRSGRLRIELRRRRRLPPLSPQRIRRLDVDR